jgi:glycosidase
MVKMNLIIVAKKSINVLFSNLTSIIQVRGVIMNNQNFKEREKDWRNGALIYQVLVDRFYPAKDLEQRKHLYPAPKHLNSWDTLPKPGTFLEDHKYWSHELEYWGGNLQSLTEHLDYIVNLGMDVLYLNPIVESLSNHKYDASDYLEISKEYGTKEDLKKLIDRIHEHNMKIMLDGVFNHVGVSNPMFKKALKFEGYRDFFDFNDKYPRGVRLWADAPSLPELNLENDAVKDYIYRKENSVIRSYLKLGVDGWRLDVAFDLGFEILKDLRDHARLEKKDAMIVGEIWNYPPSWLKSIDGVMNFTFREIIIELLNGDITSSKALTMIDDVIVDAGIEPILKSWLVLDNHDVPRLTHFMPDKALRQLAQVLQFTLPGSPNLYYGTELGMEGAHDPMNRAPMRWDLNSNDNETLGWTKSLIALHKQQRALRIGDFVAVKADELFIFMRVTENIDELCVVAINPTNKRVSESVLLRDSRLMNWTKFDILLGDCYPTEFKSGLLNIKLDAYGYVVLKPHTEADQSYTPYKRV